MLKPILSGVVMALALVARAEIKTETVAYQQGAAPLEGFVANDDQVAG